MLMKIQIIALLILAQACTDDSEELVCPASQIPSKTAEETGAELHWVNDGTCIRTSYAPDLEAHRAEFQAALEAWQSIDCGRICFQPLVAAADENSALDLHFDHANPNTVQLDLAKGLARTTYMRDNGLILRARIEMTDEALIDPLLPIYLLHWIGHVLGFDEVDASVKSVMNSMPAEGVDAPTQADRDAFCSKYGVCE
jgi:hypothetical protein